MFDFEYQAHFCITHPDNSLDRVLKLFEEPPAIYVKPGDSLHDEFGEPSDRVAKEWYACWRLHPEDVALSNQRPLPEMIERLVQSLAKDKEVMTSIKSSRATGAVRISLRPEYSYSGFKLEPDLLVQLGSFGIELNLGIIDSKELFVSDERTGSKETLNAAMTAIVSMKLYEVVFWGNSGSTDGDKDTIYLVRAPDFMAAVEEVSTNEHSSKRSGNRDSLAHMVHEIGLDTAPFAQKAGTQILRGPYFEHAFNRGWRSWERKIEGSDYTAEWLESSPQMPPS